MNLAEILTLFDYNYWANRRILDSTRNVPHRAFVESANQGGESLRGILVHILASEWMWRMRCQKGVSPPRFIAPEGFHDIEALGVTWEEEEKSMRGFLGALTDRQLSEPVRYTTSRGASRENILWHLLFHVVNHGSQYRGEASLLLAGLGHHPGEIHFVRYLQKNS